MNKYAAILLFLAFQIPAFSQEGQFKTACIGFYNFENLFDTLDSPDTEDTEFTPGGIRHWVGAMYREKLGNLARVVSELGTELTPDGVAILGVAEVENQTVLEDFVKQPAIAARHYQIVHYESPDLRGIDVALIYQAKYFKVTGSRPVPLVLTSADGSRTFTRDMLYVTGDLDGEEIHILVNHWPSRRGGEKATQPYREAGAKLCKNIRDSLLLANPAARVLVMGDLNDDPVSPSVKNVLACKTKTKDVRQGDFFNPWYAFYKNGTGTLAYRDAWSLFDQVILSAGLVNNPGGWHYYKAQVFSRPYLIQKTGQYKGYPFRTFDFDNYIAGYSDHFPVYVFLLKSLERP
ncbi:MAG: endonuclease/exonuclease/phosphatase family protein [Saprospiraceae bacterium]|nr:MAG: endonuclease/exonuclease/phosphatase family protein [Saprospiraceae bacterium]